MRRLGSILSLGLIPALLAACGGSDETHVISDVRERDSVRREVPEGLSAAQRYGYRPRNQPPPGHGGGHGHAGSTAQQFGWETPAGWTEKPRNPGSIRKGSWTIDGASDTDCSLVALGGTGGGLLANVNRWRGEMGLEEIDEATLATLPHRELLGRKATYVNITGTYSGGMGGGGPVENARMLGLVLSLPQATLFLKLTGPAAVVEANQGAFEALADSITFGPKPPPPGDGDGDGGDDAAGDGDTPAGPPPMRDGPASASSGRFVWATPDGWEQQPARMMRIVTFVPLDAPAAWCYASRLGGTAGGLTMNIDRWRGEMGKTEPLGDEGVAKLPTIEMLGTQATLLDVEGDFAGTGGPPQKGARMLGVVCPRERDMIFVKMVGPPDVVEKHRKAFLAFCASLREDR